MKHDNMLAMILAGGRGTRLHDLKKKVAKPAVSYGGKYRIIDFPLSNCANSGIDVVGVLTQYESVLLNSYAAAGRRWGLDAKDSGVYVLPPREKADANLDVYRGTADAISQNIDFIDTYSPDYLLILSGDHIYKMNYDKMLEYHKQNNADATIAVIEVPMKEASRFGIMNTDETGHIVEFEEKPEHPKSNLASMGIYIFHWKLLRKMLLADMKNPDSNHDFGKDIIPKLLGENKRLYSYEFHGFWKDVGTIASFHETSMDLLGNNPEFDLFDKNFPIMSNITTRPPHYIGPDGRLDDCLVSNGCKIYGTARHSILSTDVIIEERAVVEDSVLLPGAHVKSGAHICRAILGENSTVEEGVKLGSVDTTKDTAVVGNDVVIGKGE